MLKPILKSDKKIYNNKILVLDLDSTLVYASQNKLQNEMSYKKFNGLYIYIRPYVKNFLLTVSKYYTVFVFTAGIASYASFVVSMLEEHIGMNIITKIYSRNDCYMITPFVIKDLKIITSDLKSCILVDDTLSTSYLQPYNHIHIKAWHGDPNDKMMANLLNTILFLYFTKDVRLYTSKINKLVDILAMTC